MVLLKRNGSWAGQLDLFALFCQHFTEFKVVHKNDNAYTACHEEVPFFPNQDLVIYIIFTNKENKAHNKADYMVCIFAWVFILLDALSTGHTIVCVHQEQYKVRETYGVE